MADDWTAFCISASLIMKVENQLGVKIPDEAVNAIVPLKKVSMLTLSDLVHAGCNSNPSISHSQMVDATRLAVRSEIPEAPDVLNFDVPMLDALLGPGRYDRYQGSQRRK